MRRPLARPARPWPTTNDSRLTTGSGPLIQKRQQIFRRNRARILKLAVFLADDELAVTVDYRQRRNALIQRDFILLYQVRILVLVWPEVNVHHFVSRRQYRSEIGTPKRQI